MASWSHHFMANVWVNKETVTDFIFWGSKITVNGDCSHEIKRYLLPGIKAMTNLDSILKSRDIILLTKVHVVKAMVFPIVMYGCESWTIKIIVAGRCFGFEKGLVEDAREIGTCFVTGQGAGIAAAQAVLQQTVPSDLNLEKLRSALNRQDVFLDL